MDDSDLDGSIAFLRPSTVDALSIQLNPIKFLRSETNALRDWRGVYEATQIRSPIVYEKIKQSSDPFKQLLEQWKHYEDATVSKLLSILEDIDRFDAIDDNQQSIEQDLRYANSLLEKKGLSLQAVENEVAGSEKVLTYDDIAMLKRSKGVARYDILILHADEDVSFADHMATVLEQQNIKVCLKDRDLLVGTMELEAVTKLISERCNKVAVILTPEFFNSTANKFYSTLAQSRAITENRRSFLPIVRRNTELPNNISMLTKLSADPNSKNPYFWRKLCLNINEKFEENMDNPLPRSIPPDSNISSFNESVKPFDDKEKYVLPQQYDAQPPKLQLPPPESNKKEFKDKLKISDNIKKFFSGRKKNKCSDYVKMDNGTVITTIDPDQGSLPGSTIQLLNKPNNNIKSSASTPTFTDLGAEMAASASGQIRMIQNAPNPPKQEPKKKKGVKTKKGYEALDG